MSEAVARGPRGAEGGSTSSGPETTDDGATKLWIKLAGRGDTAREEKAPLPLPPPIFLTTGDLSSFPNDSSGASPLPFCVATSPSPTSAQPLCRHYRRRPFSDPLSPFPEGRGTKDCGPKAANLIMNL
ncbi:Os08g0275900 [Oryza sativa Japonica Group]|uniref:Os08g0275900 protein n=1 Tax=Oryza sativa subsp. japonica TaxID=39947 RepID=C7J5T5_ORYSJ|nr:hypothetical protein DAI22_08g097800 [Oryza sativa Japonica Group]BAH94218.1 Os08g0275900 [Oryza sativa Japonica Group]|eukprot:NP_001175490.1 Os08g0275900 [Oryza sativa Japonica Group]